VARRLLSDKRVTPEQIIGLGYALYALERLPKVTDGVSCEFGIHYESGNDNSSEMRYITFRISEDELEVCDGGSVYNASVGSDSFSNPGCLIERDGFCEVECDPYDIEASIVEYLNLGADISVEDDSDFETMVQTEDEEDDDD